MSTKLCFRCNVIKHHNEFYRDKSRCDGMEVHCIKCRRPEKLKYAKSIRGRSNKLINKANRRARLLNAIPRWHKLEIKLMRTIYEKRDELNSMWGTNFQVDHIIPLQGKNVCGLHCWANLQLLDAGLNQAKGAHIE